MKKLLSLVVIAGLTSMAINAGCPCNKPKPKQEEVKTTKDARTKK